MRIDRPKLFLPWVLLAVALPAYQNCAPNLKALQLNEAIFLSTEQCMTKTSGACLFKKNAVSTAGRSVSADNLGGYQSYAVDITDLDGSGYLQNADFQILTTSTERMPTAKGFRHYYDPNSSYTEQVMAYYYTNLVRRWMISRQVFKGENAGTKIIVDSSFNGWIASRNEIHLQRDGVRFPAAFDASLIVSLYAQSEIWRASGGASHGSIASKTITCLDSNSYSAPQLCCSSVNGCGPALVSGASDFLVAKFFESQGSVVGDGWKNDPAGQTLCGLTRDATQLSSLTASMAYNRCANRGAGGMSQAMGLVYASIWWDIRKQTTNAAAFEKFFLRHLELIRGDDDFATIKTKLLNLDSSDFQGAFTSLINSEFSKRGL